METVVDWASRPEPWNEIGPRFRAECEAIARRPGGDEECRARTYRVMDCQGEMPHV